MENNILDELLNKVRALESHNQDIRSKIGEVKSKLESSDSARKESEGQVNLEDEMIVDSGEENLIQSEEFIKIVKNKEKIINSVKDHVITFVPYEQYNNLWIMGDFTDWEPKQMNKNKDIFSFPVVLIKGFKYYFSFTARDQVIVDVNQDHEINPRSNQVNNFIDVRSDDNSQSQLFDYKVHSNILVEARKNYTKARMGNEKEVILLENLVDFSKRFKERYNYLMRKKEEATQKIRKFFDDKINSVKNSEISNFETLCQAFEGRVVEKDGQLFLIHAISLPDNSIKCMRLYDNNGMKINTEYYTKKGFFLQVKFADLDINFKILSHEESENIIAQHSKNDNPDNVVKVVYKLENGDSVANEGLVYFKAFGKKLTVVKILPEKLNMIEYDIDTSGNMVNEVKNKASNMKVLFTSEEIKDEFDSLPVSLQIYYSLYKKTVNIMHIHSLNENIKLNSGFEAFHIGKTEDPNIFKNFPNGMAGTRLKIIFKNYKVNKIYFLEDETQISELKCEEFNFKFDRIVKIECEGYLKDHFAKIIKNPVYQLATTTSTDEIHPDANDFVLNHDKIEMCTKSDSDLLSGYIDLAVIFDHEGKFLDFPMNVALPACMLSFIPVSKEMELEKISMVESKKKNSDELTAFHNISSEISSKYENCLSNRDLIHSMSKEEMKTLLTTLEQYLTLLPNIGKYIEQNEMWPYLEKMCILDSTINQLISLFKECLQK